MKYVFIGAGAIGTAIAGILKNKNSFIELCDKDNTKSMCKLPYKDVLSSTDVVFLCVPSSATRDAILQIKNFLNKKTIVVSVSKGIEAKTLKTSDKILEELLPAGQPFALLYGPMLSHELVNGMIGAAVVATKSASAKKKLAEVFKNTKLILEFSNDLKGVAISGVLKNIYSIAMGMAEGLGMKNNAKGWLGALAVVEMNKIIKAVGGASETIFTQAGIGDFIATGFSTHSRNFLSGFEIAQKGKTKIESEGIVSLASMVLILKKLSKYPLMNAIVDVVIHKKNAKHVFTKLAAK